MSISATPKGGFYSESVCVPKPAHIPHNMLRKVKMQIVCRQQRSHRSGHECVDQLEDLGRERQTKTDRRREANKD